MDVGKAFIEKYGKRWIKKRDRRRAEHRCCWGKCENPMAVVYYSFPFCEHHAKWADKEIDKLIEEVAEDPIEWT